MTQPEDPSSSPRARPVGRTAWRRFLWRAAQTSRHDGEDSQGLADRLAAPRLALWQSRQRERPLTTLVSDTSTDARGLRAQGPVSKERS